MVNSTHVKAVFMLSLITMIFIYTFYVLMFMANPTTFYIMTCFFTIISSVRLIMAVTDSTPNIKTYDTLFKKGGKLFCKVQFGMTALSVLVTGYMAIFFAGVLFGGMYGVFSLVWLFSQARTFKKVTSE